MKAAAESGTLRRRRGRPPKPFLDLFKCTAWLAVQERIHLHGARNVEAAIRQFLKIGNDGRARRVIFMEHDGQSIGVIADSKKLRRWHDDFEKDVMPKADPSSPMMQRVAHMKAMFGDAATVQHYRAWTRRGEAYGELLRANAHGARPITSADLDQIFKL